MGILPEGMNFAGMGGGIGGALQTFKFILIGLLIFVVVGTFLTIILYRKFQKRKFNIPLIIITPRSDGRVVELNKGLGGYFKSKKVGGVVCFRIKRKGIGVVDIPPPASSYLCSPNRTLILAQKGVDDYEPVMPESLTSVFTGELDEKGEPLLVPILQLRAVNQEATAWHCDNAETAKKRFSFASVWEKYQVLISLMTFVFILFLIMYIQWVGMKDVVAGLADVAKSLKSVAAPVITPGG